MPLIQGRWSRVGGEEGQSERGGLELRAELRKPPLRGRRVSASSEEMWVLSPEPHPVTLALITAPPLLLQ